MGTKLHQMNNLFTTLQKTNCNVVNAGLRSSDIGAISDNISLKVSVVGGLNQLKASMERQLDCCDTDSLRNTMLKHEEIFKQQVKAFSVSAVFCEANTYLCLKRFDLSWLGCCRCMNSIVCTEFRRC